MKHSLNDGASLIHAAVETLQQGEALLLAFTDEQYTRLLPVAFNASIGGHYRHCLDHFRSLLAAGAQGGLDYDQRERNPLIESDRFAALNVTRELCAGFEQMDKRLVARELTVTCKTSYSTTAPQTASSTVGREIMYVVAHAVHHYALIGVFGGLMGVTMPPSFGVAPSTLKHQREMAEKESVISEQ